MKKKLLSMAIAVIMIASMLPLGSIFASAAEPTYKEDTVAVINGVEVTADDIVAALITCKAGGVVEIVKDFTAFGLVFQNYENNTCKWIVNGNGHTVSSPLTEISKDNYLITTNAAHVEINDLTIKTWGSGIKVMDGSQVTLNNVNVYSGGTKEGTTVDAAQREHYSALQSSAQQCSKAVYVSATTRSSVTITGGVYKAYGVAGVVLEVARGNVIVNSGCFVGEDCNFVSRVYNGSRYTDLTNVTATLTVYGGTFIKPVTDKKTLQMNKDNPDAINGCSTGAVVRGDAGGMVNIHGGTFANFSGKVVDQNGNTVLTSGNREWVILSGTSAGNNKSDVGFINVFGGDFYSFMTNDVTQDGPQVIGNQTVSLTSTSDTERVKINANIYGGNFYSTNAAREENIDRIANKEEGNPSHVPADQYSAVKTDNQTVTVYGKQFTGVTKWAFTYNEPSVAPTGSLLKVKNSNNKTYYLKDYTHTGTVNGTSVTVNIPAFVLALNGFADNGSTVTLLTDISIAPTEILNRGHNITLDGDSHSITSGTNGLTVTSGEITIKNVTINASTSEPTDGAAPAYALKIAKSAITEDNKQVDSFNLVLKLENCTFNAKQAVQDNPFLMGSVSAIGCTANGAALTLDHIYAAPTPEPPEVMEDDETPEGEAPDEETPDETPADAPTTDAPATDAPATDAPATNGGCKGAIGIGAIAVMAAAGLACGIASKKRED